MTRIIDADALKKAIEGIVVGGEERLKDYYENGSKADENAWIGGIYDAWELCVIAPTIDVTVLCPVDFPTIDDPYPCCPYKRPRGEWEEPFEMNGKSYHKCTNCHISSELILIDKYCPNCGAKMDKEADNETDNM